MKKLQFKPEDFKYNSHDLGEFGQLIRIAYAANEAQKIFDKWYREEIENAKEVKSAGYGWHERSVLSNYRFTHKAKLVCIEEIKK